MVAGSYSFRSISTAAWFVAVYILTYSLNLPFDLSLGILLCGILLILFTEKSQSNAPPALDVRLLNYAVAVFIASIVICSLLSQNINTSFRYSVAFVPAILMFILLKNSRGNRTDQLVIVTTCLLVLTAQSLLLVITAVSAPLTDQTPASIVDAAESLILIVPNDILFFVLLMPFCFYLLQTAKSTRIKALTIVPIVICLLMTLWLQSRAAVLVLIFVSAAYGYLSLPRFPWLLVCTSALILAGLDLLLGFGLLAKFASLTDSRLPLWLAGWSMFLEQPIKGFGPHTYGEFYQQYFSSQGFIESVVVDNRHTPWPHNLYIELLAEYGLFGFLTFIFLMYALAKTALKKWATISGDQKYFYAALLASLVGFGVAGIFELTLLRLWVVTYLFLMLSLAAVPVERLIPNKKIIENRALKKGRGQRYA